MSNNSYSELMAEAAAKDTLSQQNSVLSEVENLTVKKQDLNATPTTISNGQNKPLEMPTLDLNPTTIAISSTSSFDSPKRVSRLKYLFEKNSSLLWIFLTFRNLQALLQNSEQLH